MTIQLLQKRFHEDLDVLYGHEEVQSFFYLLLDAFLNINRVTYVLEPSRPITESELDQFVKAINQLKDHEPIQYILGTTEFFGLDFKVNNHTLIPRPETEELVDWIIKYRLTTKKDSLKILDIGTGSGCIAITLSKHLKNAKVYAIDVSEEAIKVAKENAAFNGVEVSFIHKDILKATELNTKFDIIVSNPPYVRQLEKKEMKPNVLNNEPHLALFVEDANPLVFYKAIVKFSCQHLKPNGTLFFEINEYLGREMIELLKAFNFKDIELKQDLFGKDRMIKGIL